MSVPSTTYYTYVIHSMDYNGDVERFELITKSAQGTVQTMIVAFQNVMSSNIRVGFKATYLVRGTPNFVYPVLGSAQNELKWLIHVQDNVTGLSEYYRLPGADLSLLGPGTEFLDIVTPGSPGLALADWINEFGRSVDGNMVTLQDIRFIA